ncbi:MAG: protein-disulfide reductase DsbD [Gammaproteobacteria bacterium]|nr:protein-disulfide reductase DsbD [Gammaproteobacteria bacterium]
MKRLLITLLAPWLAATSAVAADPLRPEQAFRYAIDSTADAVTVRWTIEPDYYLYRERMSYATTTPGVVLGDADMPEGKPYKDEFFGEMHIFRDSVDVRIPVIERGQGSFELEIRSQGCADIGLCYPPQKWLAGVTLPSKPTTLANLLAPVVSGDQPLPPEQVFQVDAELVAPDRLRLIWTVRSGYYLYRDSIKVRSLSPGVSLAEPQLPVGQPKEDEYWGKTQVYYEEAIGEVAVTGSADPLQIEVEYQGCKENSICYPPQKLQLSVATAAAAPQAAAPAPVSEQDAFAARMATGSLAMAMLLSFIAGLGLSLLPCCWPMIPILSGIIVGDGREITTRRSFALSVVYVLGMAAVYAAAGAAAAAAGQQVQAAMQTPWVIGGVSLLFIAMALSMFGLFELALPAPIANRLSAVSGRQKSGTYLGAAVMGALSALVVSACVAPPLVGVLTFIAQTGDVARGGLALFAMGIGMGVPLLVIGASGGKLLPKAGPWMTAVKTGFGFVMLALAVWMADRVLPEVVAMLAYAALAVTAGVFLGAFSPLLAESGVVRRVGQGAGLLLALYGAALLAGALAGGTNPLQPLAAFTGGVTTQAEAKLTFRRIKTVADLDAVLAEAKAANRSVMLDFYADWCTSCIEMERYTFPEPAVRDSLADVVLLQADVTANDDDDKDLLQRFGIFGPPTIVFFGPDGVERRNFRVVGFKAAEEFAAHVRQAVS